jgi:type I restriction enzyme S subunit
LNFDKSSFTDEKTYLDRVRRAKLESGDLVLTREAPMGEVCMVPENLKCCLGQRVVLIKPIREKADPYFLLYSFQSGFVQNQIMASEGTGSTVSNLRIPLIEALKIPLPNIATQRRIASILTALDDKIELNRRMNETLEGIAQAVWGEWFGKYESGGEELPEGWKEINVGELFDFVIGGDWGKDDASHEFPIRSAVIRGTDFENLEKGVYHTVPCRFIKSSNFGKRRLQPGDLLLEISGGSRDQPTGRTLLITEEIIESLGGNAVPASFCRLIRFKTKRESYFFSVFMKIFYAQGGTWEYQQQSTGISNFQFSYFSEKLTIVLPTDGKLIEFENLIEPLVFKTGKNNQESHTLTALRDALLPRLMRGEVLS